MMASVQKEAFTLAGLLTNVNIQHSAKLSAQLSANLCLNLTKPHIQNVAACGIQGFSAVITRGTDPKPPGLSINSDDEFSDSIKKGELSVPALWFRSSVDHSSGISGLALRRWRRFISPFAAVIKKPAVLSPSSFSFSISSKSSRGSRTESCKERLFFLPVAITETSYFRWCSVYTAKVIIKYLKWCSLGYTLVVFTLSTGKAQEVHKTAKPRGALTPSGLLTATDSLHIEAAMNDITTHPQGRDAHTPTTGHQPAFIWRFFSCQTSSYHTVTAQSENEARSQLPDAPCLFAARLRSGYGDITTAQEVIA